MDPVRNEREKQNKKDKKDSCVAEKYFLPEG
jgi:hypothetical protein